MTCPCLLVQQGIAPTKCAHVRVRHIPIVVVVARYAVAIIVDFVARCPVAIDVVVVVARRKRTGYVPPPLSITPSPPPSPSWSPLLLSSPVTPLPSSYHRHCPRRCPSPQSSSLPSSSTLLPVAPLPSSLSSSSLVVVGHRRSSMINV